MSVLHKLNKHLRIISHSHMINTWGICIHQLQRRNQATEFWSAPFSFCLCAASNGQETLLQANKSPSLLTTAVTCCAQPASHWSKAKHPAPFAMLLLVVCFCMQLYSSVAKPSRKCLLCVGELRRLSPNIFPSKEFDLECLYWPQHLQVFGILF